MVHAFAESGEHLAAFGQGGMGPDEMSAPGSLYVDALGKVYVVDARNAKVLVFGDKAALGRSPQPPAEAPKLKRRNQ